jgi:hypothetical protein
MSNIFDARQTRYRNTPSALGNAADLALNTLLATIDGYQGKYLEDRNVLLVDGGLITYATSGLNGTISFTEGLNLVINQKISGAAPQVISLTSSNQTLTNNQVLYATVNRTAGTATLTIASSLPSATYANQEIFLLALRKDAGDGTSRIYWRNGTAQNDGQTIRLGASGSGSGGSGTGDDLASLNFRASLTELFDEGPSNAYTSVDSGAGKTDSANYSATSAYYRISYDASKTATTGSTTTNILVSATPSFTVKTGDIIMIGTEVRRITTVTSQTNLVTDAFSAAPTNGTQITISQAVHTKELYGLALDGNSISTEFAGASFNEILVDYEDTTTASDIIYDVNTTPVIAFTASLDNSSWSNVSTRSTNQTDTWQSTVFSTAGTALYLRFFANKTSGSGLVNILKYKVFLQKSLSASGTNPTNSAYAFLNGVGTPINCSLSVVSGKTRITLSNISYGVGSLSGTTKGALKVYVNGQLLPRFVNSTLTPDGSYTEVSTTIIDLDKDYSAFNLPVQIDQEYILGGDSSTANTSNIAYINSHGFKNYLINSNFDFWQRGTAGTISNGNSSYVSVDRWYAKNALGTNGVLTLIQASGSTPGSKFGCSLQITTAPTAAQANGCELYQVVENIDSLDFLNKYASFGCYIKALGNVNQVGLSLVYNTSEAKPTTALGSESLITVNSSSFSLGQAIARSVGTLPGNSGVIGVKVRITGVSSGNLYDLNNGFVIEQAMLNQGTVLAPYMKAASNAQDELAMCQRFYQKSFPLTTTPAQSAGLSGSVTFARITTGANTNTALIVFKQTMKTNTPTVTFYNPQANNAFARDADAGNDFSSFAVYQTGDNYHTASGVANATGSAGDRCFIHYTADAEI